MPSREQILNLMDELIRYQQNKVMELARRLNPNLTEEDIRNPQDFPELTENRTFQFEDGILAGYRSARVALTAEMNRLENGNP